MTKSAKEVVAPSRMPTPPVSGDAERRLTDLGLIGFWDCDFQTERITVSPELARFYGLLCFEKECNLAELVANVPTEDQIWSDYWRPLAIDSTGVGTIQYRVYDEGGRVRWVMCRGRYTTDPDGAILKGHGIVFDVTAAKQEGKRIVSPEDVARDPIDHLADLLIEAYGLAKTIGDKSLSGSLSTALMSVGSLLARRLAKGAQAVPLH